MPVAIQYYANKERNNPVWTQRDGKEWLLAKIIFNNANMQRQQAIDHLLDTHLISEVYMISLNRNLAPNHPIYRLMHPHLKLVTAINTAARSKLLNNGGVIDMTFSIGKFNFNTCIVICVLLVLKHLFIPL